MKKIKDILTITLFSIVIFGICGLFFLIPDKEVSLAERRKLAKFPELTMERALSREFSGELESYLLDHFPFREPLRSLNSFGRFNILKQKDVNGLWVDGDNIFKHDKPFDENQVKYGIGLIERVCNTYLNDMNVYYSIIPDKTYFAPQNNLHPRLDYDKLLDMLRKGITKAKYIDIFDTLELDDYYRTDTHWSQDKIYPTAKKLAKEMEMGEYLLGESEYKKNSLSPFYGVYWGQVALGLKPDELHYLSSQYTENAKVSGVDPVILKENFGVEIDTDERVYALDRFDGTDGYDVFLSGMQPIITVECENAKTDRELVIFRDSFGSSIAPLFTGAYSKITLVDLRYIPSMLIGEFVEFNPNQDALFLYSASMVNSSMLMK